jgi:hypothetical protein
MTAKHQLSAVEDVDLVAAERADPDSVGYTAEDADRRGGRHRVQATGDACGCVSSVAGRRSTQRSYAIGGIVPRVVHERIGRRDLHRPGMRTKYRGAGR